MTRLHAVPVPDLDLDPESIAEECVKGLVRACVQRRKQLRRELAAEDARFAWLRRRLADQLGVSFIREEVVEREYGL